MFPQPVRVISQVGALKIIYWLAILLSTIIWHRMDLERFSLVNQRWPWVVESNLLSHFATWDAAKYLYLSEVGYGKDKPSCAFYPLWPFLVRWISPLDAENQLMVGILLANICSFVAWVFFHRIVAQSWGQSAANWSLVFIILFPGSLFFQSHYTESPFLLLIMILWWGLEERRYIWAAIAGFLLPLTRGIGVFVILPIAAYALQPASPWVRSQFDVLRVKAEGHGKRAVWVINTHALISKISSFRCLGFHSVVSRSWLLTAPLAGWAVYLTLMWYWTGNPFEGFIAQRHFGNVHSIGNLWDLPKFILGLFSPTEWHAYRGSVLDRCVFLLMIEFVPILWYFDKRLLVWTYVLGILPAMSGTFTSFTRFASCAFPVFIALGVFLAPPERRGWRYGLLTVFAVLHVLLVWRLVDFRWAG